MYLVYSEVVTDLQLRLKVSAQTPVQPILPPTYTDSTSKLHARSEVKRRENSIKLAEHLLSEDHSLVTVIKQCLHNNPAQRPRTGELMIKLREMMTSGNWSPLPPSIPPSLPLSLLLFSVLLISIDVCIA